MEKKLSTYHKKRNFHKTKEPSGVEAVKSHNKKDNDKSLIFVVQKHHASTLHYDFRLEIDGVLKSWAVPKGPSLYPKDKRLAVPTEDHPLEYKDFQGVIPEGEYGAGTVEIWDSGKYENINANLSMAKAYKSGKIEICLHGKKLKGNFALIKMHGVDSKGKEKPWLLLKMK